METHKIIINGNETTITTPDGFGDLIVEAFVAEDRYDAQVPDEQTQQMIPNSQTELEFAVGKIIEFVRGKVAKYRVRTATNAAIAATKVENDAMASQIGVQ